MSLATSSPATQTYDLHVGIDISARTFTASWHRPTEPPSRPITLQQSVTGYDELVQLLAATGVAPQCTRAVMETTGVYGVRLAQHLVSCGLAVSIVSGQRARHFAKANRQHAKTDAVDAMMLARMSAELALLLWTPPPAIFSELQQRLTQRTMLVTLQTQLTNQHHSLHHRAQVAETVDERLNTLRDAVTSQIRAVEREIRALLREEDEWAVMDRHLQTIPGIGAVVSVSLLVATCGFTLCETPEQLASYVGLILYDRHSGTSVHGMSRNEHYGNVGLRTLLYMAARTAVSRNPPVKAFYERLRAAGKPAKLARCAAARKLLHIAFAMAKSGQPFDPEYVSPRKVRDGRTVLSEA
jgi:transposase